MQAATVPEVLAALHSELVRQITAGHSAAHHADAVRHLYAAGILEHAIADVLRLLPPADAKAWWQERREALHQIGISHQVVNAP